MKTSPFKCAMFGCLAACALVACDKDSKPSGSSSEVAPHDPQPDSKVECDDTERNGIARIAERLPRGIGFENLVLAVGTGLTPEMTRQIEDSGRLVPEVGGVLCQGSQAHNIVLGDSGGLTVYIADGSLIAFGFAFLAPVSSSVDATESAYLKNFELSGVDRVEVLNARFDPEQISVNRYVCKGRKNIQAVAFTHGVNRTLAIVDTSKVDISRLLPASTGSVGKDAIDRLKKLIKHQDK